MYESQDRYHLLNSITLLNYKQLLLFCCCLVCDIVSITWCAYCKYVGAATIYHSKLLLYPSPRDILNAPPDILLCINCPKRNNQYAADDGPMWQYQLYGWSLNPIRYAHKSHDTSKCLRQVLWSIILVVFWWIARDNNIVHMLGVCPSSWTPWGRPKRATQKRDHETYFQELGLIN